MRAGFVRALIDSARQDERIFLLVGDVGYNLVEPFVEEFPDRFVNVGIAEQNMIGIAAGLALSGKIVFVYSLGNFPTIRCLEQIRNDVCYHNCNVNIVASGGGLAYGSLGSTHHATEDLATMRALPNMTVVAPGDPAESELATRAMVDWPGPCYLRLAKTGEPLVHKTSPDFQIGRAIQVRSGDDVTMITTGGVLYNATCAAERLAESGIQARLLSMHTLKPLDVEAVLAAARQTGALVAIEEHSRIGGLGSAVAEVLAESGIPVRFRQIAIGDEFCSVVGSQACLQEAYSLSIDGIAREVQLLQTMVSR
ncbi:MAG: transketolase [Chloroflexi bacterium]|nr:MAG: transketolase [Chloroflexota bacterium]